MFLIKEDMCTYSFGHETGQYRSTWVIYSTPIIRIKSDWWIEIMMAPSRHHDTFVDTYSSRLGCSTADDWQLLVSASLYIRDNACLHNSPTHWRSDMSAAAAMQLKSGGSERNQSSGPAQPSSLKLYHWKQQCVTASHKHQPVWIKGISCFNIGYCNNGTPLMPFCRP